MKLRLVAVSLLFTLPVPAQNKGTPLPGLREELQPEAERPAEAPVAPAPPDVPALRKKAEEGDTKSQVALADLILQGGVKGAQPEEAAALLEKAADSGDAAGQFAFARLIGAGLAGQKVDVERARFLLQQSAEAGYAPAQSAWGAILDDQVDPKGRNPDFSETIGYYRKAAAQKDPLGMYKLGKMQMDGRGMAKDEASGWKMLQEAAAAGNGLAMNEIGICYQNGTGVGADSTAAVGWFVRAGQLRIVSADPVEDALDAVARTAIQNSVDIRF